MPEIPATDDEAEPTVTTVTDGYFEREFQVDAESLGAFLVDLGEQFRDGEEVTISGDDWELPFAFGEPIELEVEFAGDEPELEVELEVPGRVDDETPDVA